MIIYLGDIRSLDDLAVWLGDGCDLLLMETGHHNAEVVCQELKDRRYLVKNLYFLHHGRGILNGFEGSLNCCCSIFPSVVFCNEGDIFDIQ